MPLCPVCRVAYIEGEQHFCALAPSTVGRLLPSHWGRRRRLTVFGLAAGLCWTLAIFAPYGFRNLDQLPVALIAGLITGVVMSFTLARLLGELGREGTMVVGLLAVPAGTLLFAAARWGVLFLDHQLGGGDAPPGSPIRWGLHHLVGLLWIWPLTLLATPAAVWTTFQLRGLAGGLR